MPVLFDTAIDNMRQGMEGGVVQPRALRGKVVPQLDALIKDKAEDTLLWGPIESMHGDCSDADKKRLTAAYREMIEGQALPAFRKPSTFIPDDYLPATPDVVGLDNQAHGVRCYAFKPDPPTARAHARIAVH